MRLRNYRGVIDSTVEFATDGVTIIEGDNEVGKTCIPEALDLILTALDSSKSKQVRDVKPVHRDEGPEVELEATSGDYRFVYSKRWIRQPHTTLGISAPRHEQLTGREAHERVEAILAETLDADLWRALRIEQGAEVTLPLFDVPSLGRALDKAAGGDRSGGREDDLWERICAERERYWTPTGQQRTERRAAERSVQEARDAVAALEEQLAGSRPTPRRSGGASPTGLGSWTAANMRHSASRNSASSGRDSTSSAPTSRGSRPVIAPRLRSATG